MTIANNNTSSTWQLADTVINSRLLIGTALYPSIAIMKQAIIASQAEVITVSIRRQNPVTLGGNAFWNEVQSLNKKLLPNTAGCHSAKEAITTALMAREIFSTHWVKLEVIGNDHTLQPDPFALLEAARELISQGFEVFPYCTDDLILCEKLVQAGCRILMPWASPIGSGKGLLNPYALQNLRRAFPSVNLIVDAGIGKPSHAAQALEMGYDGLLLNTAVARSADPVMMANAFRQAVSAGHLAAKAGLMVEQESGSPSTPVVGKPFWHQADN